MVISTLSGKLVFSSKAKRVSVVKTTSLGKFEKVVFSSVAVRLIGVKYPSANRYFTFEVLKENRCV